ncbi:adenosylcobalamin-dependent ribonucleoside-diphosphate reductase [Mycobacterium branderi]|uniref:Vitamin B12-dependent ribonucleotide reductase n=1 Tax=Mycobacterium branderi TaxID=43348 RepID=A0A7I7W833_9MYCO|nr:adenosylcobalamin-dependent ribonucleoside-diphosphate reductase [Mycobacterium branderi]MCV7231142.1 adenosylcobalamin-dependent ribonucleoside-diphosphate reductase [Mycobacterium branderi]ORA35715.1 ribonucleoside-diphosphate reductase, adenosylcobalamin-dependent [Mycobacterium branderi]BBZ12761.1 vitamin B12-dependent ribonucleoside-diphosphate reductase [Mycobacterium branderi]
MRPAVRWPARVRRRDGRLVTFDLARIETAIARAARETGRPDPDLAAGVAAAVADSLAQRRRDTATVEAIQDLVEEKLSAAGFDDVARAYILYRQRRAELRSAKELLEVRDELKLSLAAATVLRERYLLRDENDRPVESTGEMMDRVATFVAAAEDRYQRGSSRRWAEEFSTRLRRLEFLPNSPTLMNAGTDLGLLAGCFVLPVEDSIRSIFTTLGHAAEIQRAGGGTGYTFTHLRPAGDRVAGTGGTASGPVSFLRLYDTAASVVSMGGRRRGACMAVLDCSHPDIYDFVTAKAQSPYELTHFNLSVGVSNAFLRAVERDGTHRLVNPRTGKTVARVRAAQLFAAICEAAHACGDPGLVFVDTINRANPLPGLGRIEATNPCGEVPLLPYESCNLGSINLARMTSHGRVDWDRLTEVVGLAVRFLDDVIDVSRYPFAELGEATRATRKIGLGVMGLAEMLASLGIPYDSEQGVRLAGRVTRRIQQAGHIVSTQLGDERGSFPAIADSRWAGSGPLRNSQITSIAPTGTISLIAGTTAGIEPMFAIAFTRAIMGRHLLEVNPCFDRLARDRGFYRDELITEIAQRGGVRGYPHLPAEVRAAFPTAAEIAPEWHLRMQAAIQRHVDAAVSKTINLPADATVEDIRRIYLAAWKAKAKGITVYRYGSRQGQVLSFAAPEPAIPQADSDFAGGCVGRICEF